MIEGFLALLSGLATGFIAAIPPGPVNLTVIRYASHGRMREALHVAAGASALDVCLCASMVVGLGWTMERVVTNPWVKGGLALVLIAYGLKVLSMDGRRGMQACAEAEAAPASRRTAAVPFSLGVLQGAANPALFVNWTLIVGFLLGHGLVATSLAGALGFGVGAGLGALGWFVLLAEVLDRLRTRSVGRWIRSSTVAAGILLVCFGFYFSWKAVAEVFASNA